MMNNQPRTKITRATLPDTVTEVLAACQSQLEKASRAGSADLVRDLKVAVNALQLIDDELQGRRPQRPRGQRSASFIRYAVDEGERMVVAPSLKERIVEIEDVYSRS